ncbi:hypothetical protein HRbin21_01152 [bacterium HR21]|nr:hypothetical protein HRbin21_01152 [bacterium HR21]
MGIEPIRHGSTPSPAPSRTEKPTAPEKTPQQTAGETDAVELSQEARQLQEAQHREQLERIRQRLHSGFYSRPEVLHRVAERLLGELTSKR